MIQVKYGILSRNLYVELNNKTIKIKMNYTTLAVVQYCILFVQIFLANNISNETKLLMAFYMCLLGFINIYMCLLGFTNISEISMFQICVSASIILALYR